MHDSRCFFQIKHVLQSAPARPQIQKIITFPKRLCKRSMHSFVPILCSWPSQYGIEFGLPIPALNVLSTEVQKTRLENVPVAIYRWVVGTLRGCFQNCATLSCIYSIYVCECAEICVGRHALSRCKEKRTDKMHHGVFFFLITFFAPHFFGAQAHDMYLQLVYSSLHQASLHATWNKSAPYSVT